MSVASVCKLATAALLTFACLLQAQDGPSAGPPHAAAPQGLTDTSPGVTPGKLVRKQDPKYPSTAERAGVEGTVVLAAAIAKDGKVKDVKVVSGNPLLADAAVSAVRHWRYTPYLFQGAPVEVRAQLSLTFVRPRNKYNCQEIQKTISAASAGDVAKSFDHSADGGKADAPQKIYTVGGSVKPPLAISSPDPVYPERARHAKEQGTTVLSAVITPEGKVETVKLERGIGLGLDEKAIEAVCQWKFRPATMDGIPVPVEIKIEVDFRLY